MLKAGAGPSLRSGRQVQVLPFAALEGRHCAQEDSVPAMMSDAGRERAFVEPASGVLGPKARAGTNSPAGATNARDRTAAQHNRRKWVRRDGDTTQAGESSARERQTV